MHTDISFMVTSWSRHARVSILTSKLHHNFHVSRPASGKKEQTWQTDRRIKRLHGKKPQNERMLCCRWSSRYAEMQMPDGNFKVLSTMATIVAVFGDSLRIRSRQCGQYLRLHSSTDTWSFNFFKFILVARDKTHFRRLTASCELATFAYCALYKYRLAQSWSLSICSAVCAFVNLQ